MLEPIEDKMVSLSWFVFGNQVTGAMDDSQREVFPLFNGASEKLRLADKERTPVVNDGPIQ